MSDRTRGIVIGVLSVVAAAAAIFFCMQQKVLWVLVPIPALVGIMYHLLNLQPRYDNRVSIGELYHRFLAAFHQRWAGGQAAPEVSEDAAEDLSSHQPKFSSTLWAAALLTAVLAIPAAVSGGGVDLTFSGDEATVPAKGMLIAPHELSSEATGLVFAGLGVYALIILRMIGRLNSGSLHARFMITAALRATIAQVLGYFAGAANYFSDIPAIGNTAYFLIGLFYPLFVEQLRDKAIKLFTRKQPVTEPMEVKMIDGIGDDVVEILTELGITDVQHVAASDPAVLSVRSLYPFERVVDWINQAMLIRRFRENIVEVRKLNMRGISDWIPLMEPIVNDTPQRADSEAVLGYIATATGEPVEVVRVFGRAAYNDYKANLMWSLCQHRMDAFVAQTAATTSEASSPMIPISGQTADKSTQAPPPSS
jgi:hypothetical protein